MGNFDERQWGISTSAVTSGNGDRLAAGAAAMAAIDESGVVLAAAG